MQAQPHHQTKDRNATVTFLTPQHRSSRGMPLSVQLPSHLQKAQKPQSFSPLIQEFIDECGYTDK